MKLFEDWCALKGVRSFPATPASVVEFVREMAPIGIEKLWPMICEISQQHYTAGFADPTLGPPVAFAVSEVAKIDPPRSWPDKDKALFANLPYGIQCCISTREAQRDKVVKKAMSEAGALRHKLRTLENGATKTAAA